MTATDEYSCVAQVRVFRGNFVLQTCHPNDRPLIEFGVHLLRFLLLCLQELPPHATTEHLHVLLMRVTFKAHGSATQGVDTTLAEVRGSEGKKEKGWAKAGKTHALITGKKRSRFTLRRLQIRPQYQKAADVCKKEVWDFQVFTQTFFELRLSLGNEGKDGKNLNSQTWPGSPRRPSPRHPRPPDNIS